MKIYLFVAVLVAALLQLAVASEECPLENCVAPEHCDNPIFGGTCNEANSICCAVVKREFRTHCRHHGGLCMKRCNAALTRDVVDCSEGESCCVLV